MHRSDTRNNNGLEISLLQHFIKVLEDLNALQVLSSPFLLSLIWGSSRYYVRASSELMEVLRVAFPYDLSVKASSVHRMRTRTHATEACDSDAKFWAGHLECE